MQNADTRLSSLNCLFSLCPRPAPLPVPLPAPLPASRPFTCPFTCPISPYNPPRTYLPSYPVPLPAQSPLTAYNPPRTYLPSYPAPLSYFCAQIRVYTLHRHHLSCTMEIPGKCGFGLHRILLSSRAISHYFLGDASLHFQTKSMNGKLISYKFNMVVFIVFGPIAYEMRICLC